MCSSSLPLDTGAPEPPISRHPLFLLHLLNFTGWLYVVHCGVGSRGCQRAGNTSNRPATTVSHRPYTVRVLRRLMCRCTRLPKKCMHIYTYTYRPTSMYTYTQRCIHKPYTYTKMYTYIYMRISVICLHAYANIYIYIYTCIYIYMCICIASDLEKGGVYRTLM